MVKLAASKGDTIWVSGRQDLGVDQYNSISVSICFLGNYWLEVEGIFVKGPGISRELLEFQNYSTARNCSLCLKHFLSIKKMLESRPEDALVKLVKLVNVVKLVKPWRLY